MDAPATTPGTAPKPAFKPLVFSGVQPTGNLHLGNYLGAITKFVALQDTYDCIYCVVDLHAITVWQDPAELTRAIREVTAAFIACGIDPKKHIIFNQSQVAEHAELAWVFNCVARLGWLNRMTQFKEKAGKDRENASVGLYAYPNLMAADILVYRATHVPVGEDQKQHLELARDIAQKFNNDFAASIAAHGFGEAFFPLPEPLIQGPATRVMSLRDGSKKMSKSDAVGLFAHQSDRRCRHHRAENPQGEDRSRSRCRAKKKASKPRPEADNLVGIYAALNGTTKADVLREFGGAQFSTFKTALVDLAVAKLGPIGREMKRLVQDPAYIDSVLADGSAARAGDRRRNHEGGQGHRRLRAACNSHCVNSEQSRRLSPVRGHATIRACARHASVPTVRPMSNKRRSYEAGHKPKYLVVIDDTAGMRPRGLFRGRARRAHRVAAS